MMMMMMIMSKAHTEPQEKKKVQEATVDERVAILELHREDLVRQKGEVEAKLAEIRARIKASAEAEEGGAGGGR